MPRGQWIGLGLAAALAVALTAGLVFAFMTMNRTSATPTPVPVLASPTAAPSLAQVFATSTPPANAPTPTPPGVGQRLQVANTGNEGVNLRREPGPTGEKIKTIRDGTPVEVVGPDRSVDGATWRNVRDLQGETGWIAGSFLAAEGSLPAAGIPGSNLGPAGAPAPVAPPAPAASKPSTGVAPSGASRGQVGNTNGLGANVRSEPGPSGRILKTLSEGSNIEVLGPEREVDGQIWRQVRDTSSGVTGWIVRGAVAPAGSVATPAPVVTRAPATGATSAPAVKPSTGSGPTPSTPSSGGSQATPGAKPTTPPGDLPIIIQPATPRTTNPQTAPRPTAPGGAAPKPATKPGN